MKPTLLTQAFKVFMAETMQRARKVKAILIKPSNAKIELVEVKADLSKTHQEGIKGEQKIQ